MGPRIFDLVVLKIPIPCLLNRQYYFFQEESEFIDESRHQIGCLELSKLLKIAYDT